ncbi:hypothetical protein QAD02_014873 [Eretmocerus hayati]|uniref:Uncharacterized protein n=1 Tax=Eretmocerus hayati TaxID=131215 RepID=A0ACC2P6P1_9HYME|nr:hypothetical protein QAD02_014873 [Eretmocerus hayati]
MAPKVVKLRFKDSMRKDRYLPVEQVWQDELNVKKFQPQNDTDFKERVEYFAFSCACQDKPCSCDENSPCNHFKCFIYALGDSREAILAAKKKRIRLPKKPYDNSISDDDDCIQGLTQTRKSKRELNKQKKNLAKDVRTAKSRKTMDNYNSKKIRNTLQPLSLDKSLTRARPSTGGKTMQELIDELEYYKSLVKNQDKHSKCSESDPGDDGSSDEELPPSKKFKLLQHKNCIQDSSEESDDQDQENRTTHNGSDDISRERDSVHEGSYDDDISECIEEVLDKAGTTELEVIERVATGVTESNSTNPESEVVEPNPPVQDNPILHEQESPISNQEREQVGLSEPDDDSEQEDPIINQEREQVELSEPDNDSEQELPIRNGPNRDQQQHSIVDEEQERDELIDPNDGHEQELPIQNGPELNRNQDRVVLPQPNNRRAQPARLDRPRVRANDPNDPNYLAQVHAELVEGDENQDEEETVEVATPYPKFKKYKPKIYDLYVSDGIINEATDAPVSPQVELYKDIDGKVYISDNHSFGIKTWNLMLNKKVDLYCRDVAIKLWKRRENRYLDRTKVSNKVLPNQADRSPRKPCTPEKLEYYFGAIEHCVDQKVSVQKVLRLDEDEATKLIGNASKILTNSTRDARLKCNKPVAPAARNRPAQN